MPFRSSQSLSLNCFHLQCFLVFAYSNPRADLRWKAPSVHQVQSPATTVTFLSSPFHTMKSVNSAENMRIHRSWHLTQGKRLYNKGTSRHIRDISPLILIRVQWHGKEDWCPNCISHLLFLIAMLIDSLSLSRHANDWDRVSVIGRLH